MEFQKLIQLKLPYTTHAFFQSLRLITAWKANWNCRINRNVKKIYLLTCAPNTDSDQPALSRWLHEEILHPWLSKLRPVKIQISLHDSTDWSESYRAHCSKIRFATFAAQIVETTSNQRRCNNVASTLMRCCIHTMCPLGNLYLEMCPTMKKGVYDTFWYFGSISPVPVVLKTEVCLPSG